MDSESCYETTWKFSDLGSYTVKMIVYDSEGVTDRKTSRSKYGVKRS